jgi:hypothetical protein
MTSFYRSGRAVRGGGGQRVMEGGITIINGRPLLGTREVGWPSKGGVLKAGSTIGRFAIARRWAVGRCGVAARGEAAALGRARG